MLTFLPIHRANSQQAIRIRALESENSRLLDENLALHRRIIHMQVQLDERDRNRAFVDNVANTQKKLQEKVAEFNELLRALEMPQKRGMCGTSLWWGVYVGGYANEAGWLQIGNPHRHRRSRVG